MILYLSDSDPKSKEVANLFYEAAQSEGFTFQQMKNNIGAQDTYAVLEDHYLKVGGTD
mgnify:CR=1 FL=1